MPESNAPAAGPSDASEPIRIALFNIRELAAEKLPTEARPGDPAVDAAAAIIASVAPDVLVVQEIDQGPDEDPARVARAFARVLRAHDPALDFTHVYAGPSNTGRLSGIDLDGDGHVAGDVDRGTRRHGNDAYGFGTYPGQYSMAVLSRLPIDEQAVRSFQRLRWVDLPGNLLTGDLLPPAAREVFRVSSKSHWDVPVQVGGEGAPQRTLHLLVSHPTPPGFDGPEDKNGRRNFDEIRLWVEYLRPGVALPEDRGGAADFTDRSAQRPPFVIVGDLNARPDADESLYEGRAAIDQLLAHPWIEDSGPWLTSPGGVEAAADDLDKLHPEQSTAVFGAGMRIDYVLPSTDLEIVDGGVVWPAAADDPEGAARAEQASDHRLVWLDVRMPESPAGAP